jgi:hypothetical protein
VTINETRMRMRVAGLTLVLTTSLAGVAGCGSGTTASAPGAGAAASATGGAVGGATRTPTPSTAKDGSGGGSGGGSGSQPTWCQPPQEAVETLLGKGTVFEIVGDEKRCRFAATGGKKGVIDVSIVTAFDPSATYEQARKGERAVRCNAPLVEPAGVGEQSYLNATCFAQTFTINLYAAKAGKVFEFIYTGDPSIPVTADQASRSLLQLAKVIVR